MSGEPSAGAASGIELEPLFYPKSIAVIGASQNLLKPNGIPVPLLLTFDYQGDIFPVNPKYRSIAGIKCYPTVFDIPGEVDLAIIGVAAERVLPCLRECAAMGVKAAIVFTSGFAEISVSGMSAQQEMAELARNSRMTILGPNCLGLLNYYNGNTSSFFFHEKPGRLAYPHFLSFITQSGGLGEIIYQMVLQLSVGFNYFISTGNEADISFAQILDYLARREEVTVIGGYLEGLPRDGRLFIDACKRALERRCLVTLLKVGRTGEGAAAAASHTGALVGEDRVYDGLFRQVGVVRADDVEQMNALIAFYAAGRIPAGKRIGIITISGGGGVVVADKCPQYGLEVVQLGEQTRSELQKIFPSYGITRNPVDITSQFLVQPDLFQQTIKLVMDDPLVDAGVYFYNLELPDPQAPRRIIESYRAVQKPLFIFCWPSGKEMALDAKRELIQAGIPVAEHISSGLWAIASLADWVARAERYQPVPAAAVKAYGKQGANLILSRGCRSLTESTSKQILSAYGIPVTREITARCPGEAVQAARELGYPVALKVESADILHKTEAGGVALNLCREAEVERAFYEIMDRVKSYRPGARIEGVLVQEMLRPGLEVIVGVKQDPVFGPAVLFGLGGILVELLKDVAIRVAPLREQDAREMLEEISGRLLLEGIRGEPPRDRRALVNILLRISELAVDLGDKIEEIDITPLLVYEEGAGAIAADALIILKN
ncbi:MAG TPA: acetate--CoA ligase family protein [Firmicutes bacterium]|nr:acetate--CoA ligase family protein [Bacillota bacterium]